jgi:hypothetical protein
MPEATGANAQALPDRRSFLRSLAAAGGATLTVSAATPAQSGAPASKPLDLAAARRWRQAAVEAIYAQARCAIAKSHIEPPVPEALLIREGDSDLLWRYAEPADEGRFLVTREGVEELRQRQEGGGTRARTEEIIAAGDEYECLRRQALEASGILTADQRMDEAWDEVFALEKEILASPAESAASFVTRLRAFAFFRQANNFGAAELSDAEQLIKDDSPAVLTAVRLAIDLVDLIELAKSPTLDPDIDAFVPLGAVASAMADQLGDLDLAFLGREA